jgi:hypothetical protein
MPKDRMGMLLDPDDSSILYVAGNGGHIAYRVDVQSGAWSDLVDADTSDGSEPHCDCRNFGWDPATKSLLLVSDGGVFMRSQPKKKGGKWRSLNGVIGAMEFLTAVWDARLDRWAGGAQDNSVQVAPPHAASTAVSIGVVGGDGEWARERTVRPVGIALSMFV